MRFTEELLNRSFAGSYLAPGVDPEQMGVFCALLGGDQPASIDITQRLLEWKPTAPTLLEDLDARDYTS